MYRVSSSPEEKLTCMMDSIQNIVHGYYNIPSPEPVKKVSEKGGFGTVGSRFDGCQYFDIIKGGGSLF
jgi:hypothetical protein